jgi:ribosomal protein L22
MSVDEPDKDLENPAEQPPAGGDAATAGPTPDTPASPDPAPSRPQGDELADAVDEVAAAEPEADADAEPAAEAEDDPEVPPTDDEPVPVEEDETPVAEPEGELGEEEAEEAAAGEASGVQAPAAPRRRRRRGGAASEQAPPEEEAPAEPAPARRRSRRDSDLPAPVVRAQAKYVRSSARKARLVCDHIRGKSVEEARAILAVTPRAIARDWSKLLESAVANAEHNHELVGEDLYVKAVHADEGPTIKRFRPRAMGRATRIRKRTSHLTILLTPKD